DEPFPAGRAHRAADRLLARTVRHGGPWVGVLVVTSLLTAAAQLLLPAVLGRVLDAVLASVAATGWLVVFGSLVAVLMACDALDDVAAGASGARATSWLRRTLLRHVLALGPHAARRFTPGELSSRLVGNAIDAGRVAQDVVWSAGALIPAVGGVIALAVIDPWLCVTFLAGVPVLMVLLRTFVRDASALAARYFAVQGVIAARFVDALAGARTIAAAGTAPRETGRVLRPLPQLHRHGMAMWGAQTRITTQDALLVPLLEIAVLAVAGFELARGRITPGELIAASQYVLLAAGLSAAVTCVTRLTRARAAAGRVAEVLAAAPVSCGSRQLPPGGGELQFRGVTVRAGGEPVLADLHLVVPAGALVAVIGRSGSGKSLLAG
ncbi:MAG: ABC transporter ATP-binding protein, partial [Micromonosporaceae bacterium]|nr:ABC transporter ATP-binding protein [Micromonosporaceae bacterium]